jgi:hypothetical protein
MRDQVEHDIHEHKHKFLGFFESDFKALMQTMLVGFVSVAPTVIAQIYKLF